MVASSRKVRKDAAGLPSELTLARVGQPADGSQSRLAPAAGANRVVMDADRAEAVRPDAVGQPPRFAAVAAHQLPMVEGLNR
jgi:hypothetical protein